MLTFSAPAPIERGDKFGALVVVRESRSKRNQGPRYRCKCACGRRTFVKGSKLRKGEQTSCGKC